MSKEQMILAGFLIVLILGALPAFVMPDSVETNTTSTTEEPTKMSTPDVPETKLTLEQTTKSERKDIKRRRKVNINTADSTVLQTIPGVGPNTAEAILKFRGSSGPIHNWRDLTKIEGFGVQTAKSLKKHIKYGKENYKKPTSTSGKININQANLRQLKSLPGVGAVTAKRILEYRETEGKFQTLSDLDKISGIGMGTIDNFADKITGVSGDISSSRSGNSKSSSSGSSTGSININTAGQSELEKLPGVGSVTAKAIIKYRNNNGDFNAVDDLDAVSGIGPATLEDIRPMATAE
jgi:competence protein ComEA